jgi:hypothetical protein
MFEYDEFGNVIPVGGKGGFYSPQSSFGSNTGYQSFAAPNQYITGYNANNPYIAPSASSQLWNTGGQLAAAQTTAAQNAAAPVAPAQKPAASNNFNPVGFGLGAIQTGVGLYQLNKLSKTPVPEYKASAATLAANQRAQQMSQMGYSPSQAAAFKANMGTALNTQFANQRNLAGGNLAGALGARGTAQKLQAMNQFAVGDADRQMQNIRYADEQTAGLQRMQNMNTEAAMRRRLMTEQALGAAVQQGTVNMAGSFDTGASFSKFASMMGGLG